VEEEKGGAGCDMKIFFSFEKERWRQRERDSFIDINYFFQ